MKKVSCHIGRNIIRLYPLSMTTHFISDRWHSAFKRRAKSCEMAFQKMWDQTILETCIDQNLGRVFLIVLPFTFMTYRLHHTLERFETFIHAFLISLMSIVFVRLEKFLVCSLIFFGAEQVQGRSD